jgi:hypothetical protein
MPRKARIDAPGAVGDILNYKILNNGGLYGSIEAMLNTAQPIQFISLLLPNTA